MIYTWINGYNGYKYIKGGFWQKDSWPSLKMKSKGAHASAWKEEAVLNVLGVLSPCVVYKHNV